MVFTRDLLGWVLDEISFVNLFTDKLQKLFTKKDTSDVWRQLVIWMFTDEDDGVIRFADKDSGASDVVHDILSLFAEKLRARMLSLTNENQDLALKLFLS